MIKTPLKINKCLAAASLLVVFAIDIVTPTEFVADVLYFGCILLVFKENSQTIFWFSAGACLLITLDVLFLDINLKLSLSQLINRGMAILVILIISYIAVIYRKLNEANLLKEQKHLKSLEKILFITSHHVRKPVANVIGLINIINNDSIVLTSCELKDTYQHLLSSANELDSIIKELNAFIEQAEQQDNTLSITEPKVIPFTRQQHREYSENVITSIRNKIITLFSVPQNG